MKSSKQLLNNIIGQLNGVSRMIEEEKDCHDVIIQLKAVKSAVASLMNHYIEDNAMICLGNKNALKASGKEQLKKLFKELINN